MPNDPTDFREVLDSLESLPLQFSVGSSIIPQFASGHDPSDVMEELVQNEYDAEGSELRVSFERDSLVITGNGKVIDDTGWARLSVMLGTGEVVGSDGARRVVEPKQNGIGSKNFGLRSLFLYGDQIVIASGGRQTVLDARRGSLPRPIPHPGSQRRRGVVIKVPYRTVEADGLQPFDEARERSAIERIAQELPYLLIKLARLTGNRSLSRVRISSERAASHLSWSQSVTRILTRGKGITALRRMIETRHVGGPRSGQRRIVELEFQRDVTIPTGLRSQEFPDYYLAGRNKIRVSVSVRLLGNKPDLESPGIFFYPLGMRGAHTGNRVHVSAPFSLDQDRSQLVDSTNSPWNGWLLAAAADLTVDLLAADWFERFGPAAYSLLENVGPPQAPDYIEAVGKALTEEACWPSRAGRPSSPIYVKASDLVLPTQRELHGLMHESHYLHANAAEDSRILKLAKVCGAKEFNNNSLVRLYCAGEDARHLQTALSQGEANYCYGDFPAHLRDTRRRDALLEALDSCYRNLTKANWADFADAPVTLTASGDLAPASSLWWVDYGLRSAPLRPEDQVHPSLTGSKSVRRVSRQFDISNWTLEVAQRVQEGSASEEDRESLYSFLISRDTRLSRKAILELRRSAVVRDHQNRWAKPADIIPQTARYADKLAPVLSFPHKDFAANSNLARTLRFRKKVAGSDVVRYAELVSANPPEAHKFESLLEEMASLLTKPVLRRLRDIVFLETSQGDLGSPSTIYIRNPVTLAGLGPEGRFAAGNRIRLYRKLQCRENPDSGSILRHLEVLAEAGEPPGEPETLYTVLIESLRRERLLRSVNDKPILWTGDSYAPPDELLVGRSHARTFFESVPIFSGTGTLMGLYEALGASRRPRPGDWRKLLTWIGLNFASAVLTRAYRDALLDAYSSLADFEESMSCSEPYLVDRAGRLHSETAAKKSLYLIDDEPTLADEVEKSSREVSFALMNSDPRVRMFYRSIGVKNLTEVRRFAGVSLGDEVPAPKWLSAGRLLDRIKGRLFTTAIKALAGYQRHDSEGGQLSLIDSFNRKVQRISELRFHNEITIRWKVAGVRVDVPAAIHVDERAIYLGLTRRKSDLFRSLSHGLATLVTPHVEYSRSLADSIYIMLTCETDGEIARYLRGRGIPLHWQEQNEPDEPTDEEAEDIDDTAGLAEKLASDLIRNAAPGTGGRRSTMPTASTTTPPSPSPPLTLPPLDDVIPRHLDTTDWQPADRGAGPGGGGGGGGGWWTPPTPEDQERDKIVGERAEKLVYREEQQRVAALGYSEDRVVWTSRNDPGADHDIQSVDDDGGDLWIEVKGTLGRSGNFQWSVAEFKRALQEGARYVIVRVYEAASTTPSIKRFCDPVSRYQQGSMRLDISSLAGQVEPA